MPPSMLLHWSHALLAQPTHHLQAAHSVMTEHDQGRLFRLERWQRLRNAAHRDELASVDVRLIVFKRLADIHQAQLFTGIETLFYFTWCDLKRF